MYNTIIFCYHVVRNSQTLHLSYHNYITPKTSYFTQYSINRTYTVFHVQHMLYNNWGVMFDILFHFYFICSFSISCLLYFYHGIDYSFTIRYISYFLHVHKLLFRNTYNLLLVML